jgi:hypothetical protein
MNGPSSFAARYLSAPEYVLALHDQDDEIAVLVRNRQLRRTTQRILPARMIAGESFQSWLQEQNENGADIFIGMNPVKPGVGSRAKESIREIRHAYVDLDEGAQDSLRAIRESGDLPAPNFVLDTSPEKHQVVWRIANCERTEAEALLRALASQYGGDPAATDVSRLLRVPGFRNHKYGDAFIVQAHHESNVVHQLNDFRIREDSPESPHRLEGSQSRNRRNAAGHRSQSEADWAYAKRALARGDNPEEVIARIADFRAEDKADPLYYARLTVTKAKADLRPASLAAPQLAQPSRVEEKQR